MRHLIENAFCRLIDFRRVANRYDKLATNVLFAVSLAAVAFWLRSRLNLKPMRLLSSRAANFFLFRRASRRPCARRTTYR